MPRHNFLIQRHINGPDGSDANVPGKGADWRDSGTRERDNATTDEFGNTGYASVEQARKDIKRLRRAYPNEAYRIIQIVS